MMPIVGYLLDLLDARKILLFGLGTTAIAIWYMSSLNLNAGFNDLATVRAFQAFGLSFLAASINTVAYYHLPEGKSNSAASLLNLVRNTGASMSLAFAATLLQHRTETHANNLSYHASNYNPNFVEAVGNITKALKEQGLNAVQAKNTAYGVMWETIVNQASMKAVLDVFQTFLILFVLLMPLVFILKKKGEKNSGGGH